MVSSIAGISYILCVLRLKLLSLSKISCFEKNILRLSLLIARFDLQDGNLILAWISSTGLSSLVKSTILVKSLVASKFSNG